MSLANPAESLVRLSGPLNSLTVARHSGPGLRLILWTQGCSLLCTRHCLNPHLLRSDSGHLVSPSELGASLLNLARDYREVEGVTVLGGEPFDQASALSAALADVHGAGLSIMLYTGHTLESLRGGGGADAQRLLTLCDILVDGPFVDELFDETLVWRGSTNQRVLLLSGHYTPADIELALARQRRGVSVTLGPDGTVAVSGAQDVSRARALRRAAQALAQRSPTSRSKEIESHEQ